MTLTSRIRRLLRTVRGVQTSARSEAVADSKEGPVKGGGKRGRRPAEPQKEGNYPEELVRANESALAQRPFLDADHEFKPISLRDRDLRRLKRKFPYFGYVGVKIEGIDPFVMFSNNDDPVAQVYFWYGPNPFETLSLRMWRELARTSDRIFDVGTFTGVYTLAATRANPEARVYCFEPIAGSLSRLLVNLAVNPGTEGVSAFKAAVGDTDGLAEMNLFNDPHALLSGSSLVPKGGKEVVAQERVETVRLDTFVRDHAVDGVDLIKVDVERAESMVVSGMVETLQDSRPHLLVEVFGADNLREIAGMLPSYSFAVIDDMEQKSYVDEPEIPEGKALNVLFSPGSSDDLRDFCASMGPLSAP